MREQVRQGAGVDRRGTSEELINDGKVLGEVAGGTEEQKLNTR